MEIHSNKKVLITGIAGFTGVYLERFLIEKGYEVYGTTYDESISSRHFRVNILDDQELLNIVQKIKPNFVIHLAAISFVASDNKSQIYDVNVLGTISLLNAIKSLKKLPFKIILSSSATVYGNLVGELEESLCLSPVNHYGNSKLVMENMAKTYFSELNILIVRPFNYTGLGQDKNFLTPKIVSHFITNKKEISLGNIDVYREFNDVNFVIRCYYDLLVSNVTSEIINICTGYTTNIRSMIAKMEDISGHKIDVKINPKFIRKNEIELLKGCPKKLLSILGDYRNEYSLSKTLLKMYNRQV